ncbi:SEL1-like repeat protein [Qipengyuania sp. JC766]|uniref:SEL1-like repeat protein n=1 Tax=Qipengyuania sp. JC766 TaxID=3232139 RepID=UPI0034584EB1
MRNRRMLRPGFKSCIATTLAWSIAGCAAPSSYMGIPFTSANASEFAAPEPLRARRDEDLRLLVQYVNTGCLVDRDDPAAIDLRTPETIAACRVIEHDLALAGFPITELPSMFDYSAYPLSRLAQSASTGNKSAQLELGLRFEAGRDVPVDYEKARELYASAARTSCGPVWVYVPPVGNGTSGRTMQVDTGPLQPGLAVAKRHLEALDRKLCDAGEARRCAGS